MTPAELILSCRCEICGVPLLAGDRAVWCKWRTCTRTAQRGPTDAERKLYRMDEQGHPAHMGGERG